MESLYRTNPILKSEFVRVSRFEFKEGLAFIVSGTGNSALAVSGEGNFALAASCANVLHSLQTMQGTPRSL